MRQDAQHRNARIASAPLARQNVAPADATGQFRFDYVGRAVDRPLTLGRIGPRVMPRVPRDWHAHGVELERAGDLHGAVDHYRRALIANGPDVQTIFDLAHALAELGQTQLAIERYRQVVEIDPRRADAWSNLADQLIEDEQLDAGIDALNRALDLDPHDAAVHYNLADALERSNEHDAAGVHYRAFLRLTDADEFDPHVRYAWSCVSGPVVPSKAYRERGQESDWPAAAVRHLFGPPRAD